MSKAKGPSPEALDSPAFEGLLTELARIVRRAKKTGDDLDQEHLRTAVRASARNYGIFRFAADDAPKRSLHEIGAPLRRVIEALRSEDNESAVVFALGRHKPGYYDIDFGVERRAALIADLEKIAAIQPPKRRRGPTGNRDLYQLVHSLANDWPVLTGRPFTQDWDNGTPATGGAAFVHAVVEYVDRDNLKSVPKMTERVVADRRRGQVMPWLTLTSSK